MTILRQENLKSGFSIEPVSDHTEPRVPSPRLFSLAGLFCAFLVALSTLLIWPVAAVGIQDDPIYTFTAFDFARTGHFIFHGWASPVLGWQAIWGALFVKLFGATFTAVRMSMVPVAMFSALLYHAILRRFGLNPAHATFGALCFVLGPLFLPQAASFMTDVPGVFAVLVCLYLCQLALDTPSDSGAILFLTFGALSNVVLGTARQSAWLGLLVVVPSCAWLMRRRRFVLPAGIVLWFIGAVCIWLISRWYAHQPYTAPEKLIAAAVRADFVSYTTGQFIRAGMTTLLFLLPVLTLGLRCVWPLRRLVVVGMAAVLLLIVLLRWKGQAHLITFPWLPVTVGHRGILHDTFFRSDPPISASCGTLLFLIVVTCALGSLQMFAAYRRQSVSQSTLQQDQLSWRDISVLLLPFLVFNWLLFLPRAIFFALYDRYLLEILAVLIVYVLRWHQEHVSVRIPFLAVATMVLLSVLTVADTHDLFSAYRAQMRLTEELQNVGIPRTQIRGGFAFDLMTQVYAWGYINDPRMLNPPGAYKPQPETEPLKIDGVICDYPMQQYVPVVRARYELTAESSPCLTTTNFPPESYHAWLPPFTRQLFVRGIVAAQDQPHPTEQATTARSDAVVPSAAR